MHTVEEISRDIGVIFVMIFGVLNIILVPTSFCESAALKANVHRESLDRALAIVLYSQGNS